MSFDEIWNDIKDIDNHYGMSTKEGYEWVYRMALKAKYNDISNTMLEIGVCHGRTAVLLCKLAPNLKSQYFGMDNFSLEGSAEEVMKTFGNHLVLGNLLIGSSHDIPELDITAIPWERPINFLLIDGDHRPEAVERDCARYIPLMKSGGVVVFDDWDEPYNPESAHEGIHRYGMEYCGGEGWEDLGGFHNGQDGLHAFRKL